MAKKKPASKSQLPAKATNALATNATPADFETVVALIRDARAQALAAVNTTLVDLYWRIGAHLSAKIAAGEWGDGTVEQLATHIRQTQPNATGFSARTLWRMRQFHDTY